jgi:hypothetical protein
MWKETLAVRSLDRTDAAFALMLVTLLGVTVALYSALLATV